MMENHSYDNYLGMLGRGDGFASWAGRQADELEQRRQRPARPRVPHGQHCQLPRQPSQTWSASHVQYADGTNEGFVRSDSGPVAMGYWTGDDIPFYYGLAGTFPVCDRWYGSVLAQTYPNRRFLLAATALRHHQQRLDDRHQRTAAAERHDHGAAEPQQHSVARLLHVAAVGRPVPARCSPANGDKVVNIDQYFTDAAAGTLPAFSLVEPNYDQYSEENSDDITRGESFSSKVINAAMHGPAWSKTMLIWCYDEHGGYYDHVPPPAAVPPDNVPPMLGPNDPPGDVRPLRLPRAGGRRLAVCRSATTCRTSCTTTRRSSASSRHKFNLPALTERDAHADNLLDCLDLTGDPAFLDATDAPGAEEPGLQHTDLHALPVRSPIPLAGATASAG